MPIREPGVIVHISGEQLPPPNPPTRFGYAGYVFAQNGPFKTRPLLNSRYPKPFYNILPGVVSSDISFLKAAAPLYGQVLPNLGHRRGVAIFSYEDDNSNNVQSLISANQTHVNVLFSIPFWLIGPPKYMIYMRGTPSTFPSANVVMHNTGLNIDLFGISQRTFIPDIMNAGSALSSSLSTYHVCVHGELKAQSPAASFEFVIWTLRTNSWPDKNIYTYVRYDHNTNTAHIYVWSDDDTALSSLGITIKNTSNVTLFEVTPSNYVLAFSTSQTPNISATSALTRYNGIFITSYDPNITLSVSSNPAGSANPYKLTVQEGSTSTDYDLSYSPLDTGYFGFLSDDRLEIFLSGNVYDHVTNPPAGYNVQVGIANNMTTPGYFSTIPFSDPHHDFRAYYARMSSFFPSGSFTTLPDTSAGNPNNPLYDTTPPSSATLVYLRKYVTRVNADNLYNEWTNAWNSSVVYLENDVRPIKESPLQADLIGDYGGEISYGFTKFIRSHDKLMFKVLGSGDLTNVRMADALNYVKYYWTLFDLQGYHYIRHQGFSTTGVSSSAIYTRATFDYRFNAIFGINATLAVSDADYEFPKLNREELLEKNVNTIVKDRALFFWYFNNNLTEEPRRDDSPLGEECNARYAIRLTKLLGAYVDRFIGQPNNAVTRNRITSDLTTFIQNFMNANPSNMQSFKVICDESNNTPADIANNRLNIRVEARFGKSIKYIVIFERVVPSL